MGYVARSLLPDEKLIYQAEIHWFVYLRGLAVIIIGVLLGRYGPLLIELVLGSAMMRQLAHANTIASLVVIAYGTYELLRGYIRQVSTELVITNRRVIAKYGFIATTTFELMMGKVEGANVDQTIWGRLLGFGTVYVKGTGGGISPIDHISQPQLFHNYLMKIIEYQQQHSGHTL